MNDCQELATMQVALSGEAVKALQRLEARIKVLEEVVSQTRRGEVNATQNSPGLTKPNKPQTK